MAKSKKSANATKASNAAKAAATRATKVATEAASKAKTIAQTLAATTKAKELRSKIEERLEKTLERTIEKSLHYPQVVRARDTALAAKKSLDEALLDLQHRALELKKDPQDVIQKVGFKVLERAEAVRAQIADKSYSPAWLKDISLTPKAAAESAEESSEERAAGVVVEASADNTPENTPGNTPDATVATRTSKARAKKSPSPKTTDLN